MSLASHTSVVSSKEPDQIEVIDAEVILVDRSRGNHVRPSEMDDLPVEIFPWAIKVRDWRMNLRLAFGRHWHECSPLRKAVAVVGGGGTIATAVFLAVMRVI